MKFYHWLLFLLLSVAVVRQANASATIINSAKTEAAPDTAIELNPDDADAYVLRSAAKVDKGDLDGAVADGTKAIAIDPDEADAYINRGIANLAKGE